MRLDLSDESRHLVSLAKEAMANAYAPYSGFRVGAALMTSEGRIYTGCNIENISFGATVCAERTALFKAVSDGEREFIRLAVVSSANEATFPCGICRQVMAELMPEGEIILSQGDEIRVYTLSELMPHSFNNEF